MTAFGINVMELDPRCDGYPEHDHEGEDHEEVYVVLRGSLDLVLGEERSRRAISCGWALASAASS